MMRRGAWSFSGALFLWGAPALGCITLQWAHGAYTMRLKAGGVRMDITQTFYDSLATSYDKLFEDWAAAAHRDRKSVV